MIKNVLSRWNPLNIFGTEVEYQDLLHQPLEPDEKLMQDSRGHIYRLKVSSKHSTFWETVHYWIQIHLNKKGHLDAIDKLLSSIDSQTLQCSFLAAKEFKEIKTNLESLKSLKNDYHFRQSIDIKIIDKWLAEIEDKAFSIFEYSMQKMAREQGEERKIFLLTSSQRLIKLF
ncbi:hypothetical protein PRO82_001207 [Candidatus Protochlamydia amoebophila]|uniref:hypothetical protein n=1 Tax=Candidatus Protochlamydia amoebophila TaxID=362787 RepID=UPI001BCA2D7B|nr:hypothetical protein [Candidatus Protochlamydia amoebophila]MBS4163899.1 hypothetical protein [Candidatus Protochlamydia amoebophila]